MRSLVCLLLLVSPGLVMGQQVPNPPEDARPYLSVFTHNQYRNIPHEAELVKAFDQDPNLRAIRGQCRYNHYTETDPLYRDRYRKLIPPDRFPAIMLQRNDGGYVYKATGSNVPDSPADIFDEMAHYAKLDPLKGPADSTEARPYSAWQIISQSDGGVPDIDGPPSCPDGICPDPSNPSDTTPDSSGIHINLPDSSEMLGGSGRPIRDMGAAVVFMIGIVLAGALGVFFLIALVVVIFLVSKAFR